MEMIPKLRDAKPNEKPFPFERAWVTLLTRTSYLPGVVLLAHSLQKQTSKYPLLTLITPSFPSELISPLKRECELTNGHLVLIDPLFPPPENTPESLIAERFADTWTKLRVFELYKYGFEKMIWVDADMLLFKNMDSLFDLDLPRDWIAACHVCVCNLDDDKWAPKDWNVENCAFTGLGPKSPPTRVPNIRTEQDGKQTHTLLNSGIFIFSPFESQWQDLLKFLNTDLRVKSYILPDQDFLGDMFEGKWKSIGWQYNALKTWRYWHPNLWRDDEVVNLHYIVDKPWNKRVGPDGKAGYLGNDAVTHQWWWDEYNTWEMERECQDEREVLEMVRSTIPAPLQSGV